MIEGMNIEEKNSSEINSFAPPDKNNESSWPEFIKFTLLALAVVIPFRLYIAQPFIVSGESMSPTFESGQYLIIEELSYRFEKPKRGDVIILKKPRQESEYLIKRVIGLPGETVIIKNGVVSIKDAGGQSTLIDEPYVKNKDRYNLELTVPAGEYFVMGDNRPVSLDSRIIGSVPEDHVVGHALLRLFPLSEIAVFPGQN